MKEIFLPFEKTNKMNYIYLFYFVVFFISWYIYSQQEIHVFPSIAQIQNAFIYLYNNGLVIETFTSIFLCLKSLFIGVLISCLIVYLSPINFFKPLSELASGFRFLPLIGFTYYFGLMFDNGRTTQTIMLSIFLVFFTVASLLAIIKDIKPEEYDHVYSINFSKWQIIKELVILSRLSNVFDVIRINFAITLFMLVQVESSLRSNGGIGSLIHDAEHLGLHENLIALQLVVLAVGLFFDKFFYHLKLILFGYV